VQQTVLPPRVVFLLLQKHRRFFKAWSLRERKVVFFILGKSNSVREIESELNENNYRWSSTSLTKKAESCSKKATFLCQINKKCFMSKEMCEAKIELNSENTCFVK